MRLAAGIRLGPYEIVGPLGAGGMGEVYKARDPRIGRDVAVKVLPPEFAANPDRLQRFKREARATGALNHPNLLALYDVGTAEVGPYLVSELLEGESLRARLRRGPISVPEALDWCNQVALGLSAAHERGVVHRDLKPDNVFLLRDGRVKVLDFGLAKFDGQPLGLSAPDTATGDMVTSAGVTLGTAAYMAPEQVRGEPVGPAADIFALGVLLYELVAGRPAFQRSTSIESMNAILNEDPPPLPSAPDSLRQVISHCLAKDPAARFRSVADVGFALVTLAGATAPRRTLVRQGAMAAVAVSLLLGAGLWFALQSRDAPAAAPLSVSRMTPFLASESIEKQPAWSPAGDLIAYVSDAAGNDDIWISDPSGANPVNLTPESAAIEAWPEWSPDGRNIAFYAEREGPGIYVMAALGGNVRRVAPLPAGVLYTFSLSWALDSSLVYTSIDDSGLKRIYRVSVAGGEPACITCAWPEAPDARAGELSPSGVYLAFLSGVIGPRADLHVAHLPSGRVRKVTNQADWPHWSPDGRRLFFISNRDGQADLWQITIDPADGSPVGEPRKLTSALGATTFTLAPDGMRGLAVKEASTSHLWSFPAAPAPVSELTAGTQLTVGNVRDDRGRWSSDGRSIFFQSARRGSIDIWRLTPPATDPERLTTVEGSELRPRPSTQADWVAVDIVDARGEFTHLMRPDGSQLHALDDRWFSTYSQVCCADWSPDGSRLVVVVTMREPARATTIAVASVDRATGKATAIRPLTMLPGGQPEYGRWSPDGRFVVYEALIDGNWDLWIVDPDAPTPRRLTRSPRNDRQAVWQDRPRGLYFLHNSHEVWRLPFDDRGLPTSEAERWLVPPRRLRVAADSLDISPAGDRLLLTLLADASDIWLVEFK